MKWIGPTNRCLQTAFQCFDFSSQQTIHPLSSFGENIKCGHRRQVVPFQALNRHIPFSSSKDYAKMKVKLTFLVVLFLISVAVDCADPDLEVKKNPHDGLGLEKTSKLTPKIGLNEKSSTLGSNSESKQADPLEKAKVSNDIQNATVDKTKNVPSKLLGDGNVQMNSKDKQSVEDVKTKSTEDKGSGSKNVPKEEKLSSTRKGSFRGEQCDSSFKCTIGNDENHGMVACLSVPGDESTEVSLLIQNKGKGPLDVDINAPDFVRLEKTKIQIQENDDQKVMVSIGEGKTDKFITLKTRQGDCSLDFMDFLTHNPMKKPGYISQLTYTNLFRRTPFLGLLSLALLLVIASVLVCVTYQRRRFLNSGTKYQKLDAELPVSKIDFEQKDGWDDNWSDDWDDVEAPSTPSMPLTPSISSAGVSSRRVNKDGWKD